MFKKILLAIGVVIVMVLAYAATRPDTFRVERTAVINAAPDRVFAQINDLHNWPTWSVWEKKDPAMKKSFGGAAAGQGATYGWEGNSNVGTGRMEIVESVPDSKVRIKLDFVEPIEGHNFADLVLRTEGAGTRIIWSMDGPSPFISKLMGVIFDMDKMIGKDFEDSLSNLKQVVEKQA
jgi:uncharacterized protein YndB with AHSA1/START domain